MQDRSLSTPTTSILHWPELGVCRVPYQVFTDQALYDLEQDYLFRGDVWYWVGLEAETPHPGDFKANAIGDTPVVMIRDLQGAMKVFVNRCAHRGARLCLDNYGNTKGFTYVYHNWSYDLDTDRRFKRYFPVPFLVEVLWKLAAAAARHNGHWESYIPQADRLCLELGTRRMSRRFPSAAAMRWSMEIECPS